MEKAATAGWLHPTPAVKLANLLASLHSQESWLVSCCYHAMFLRYRCKTCGVSTTILFQDRTEAETVPVRALWISKIFQHFKDKSGWIEGDTVALWLELQEGCGFYTCCVEFVCFLHVCVGSVTSSHRPKTCMCGELNSSSVHWNMWMQLVIVLVCLYVAQGAGSGSCRLPWTWVQE